jgi:hypothetical protein
MMFSYYFSLTFLVVCNFAFISMSIIIYRNRFNLKDPAFVEKFGTLTEGLRGKSFMSQQWNIFLMIRWSLTAIIVVIIRNHPNFQISLLMSLTICWQCMIVYSMPFEEYYSNHWGMLNELLVSLYLYALMVLFLFGQGRYPDSFRDGIGWVLIAIVIASVSLNFINFIVSIVRLLRRKFLFCYYFTCRKKAKTEQMEDDLPPVFVDSQEDVHRDLDVEDVGDDRFAYHLDEGEQTGL